MAEQQLIMAIGRIERALSRIEQVPLPASNHTDLSARHDILKSETKAAIAALDALLAGQKR